jgi:hypothetical protein
MDFPDYVAVLPKWRAAPKPYSSEDDLMLFTEPGTLEMVTVVWSEVDEPLDTWLPVEPAATPLTALG